MIAYVFYDDTDCGGIVYHTNYIKFCERARSLLFFKKDLFPQQGTCGFVVKTIESKFIASLRFGDKYKVLTTLLEMKNTNMIVQQNIIKIGEVGNKEITETLVFSMKTQLVYIDITTKKPRKIPDILKTVIQQQK